MDKKVEILTQVDFELSVLERYAIVLPELLNLEIEYKVTSDEGQKFPSTYILFKNGPLLTVNPISRPVNGSNMTFELLVLRRNVGTPTIHSSVHIPGIGGYMEFNDLQQFYVTSGKTEIANDQFGVYS